MRLPWVGNFHVERKRYEDTWRPDWPMGSTNHWTRQNCQYGILTQPAPWWVSVDGSIAKHVSLVHLTATAELGMPHTRMGAHICIAQGKRPDAKTVVHELVHIWQYREPEKWDKFLRDAWTCVPCPERMRQNEQFIPMRQNERFNPDTFYAGSYVHANHGHVIPSPQFQSGAKTLMDVNTVFYSTTGQKTGRAPEELINLFGEDFAGSHKMEHPFESAAYIIADWYMSHSSYKPASPATHRLINTITQETLRKTLGNVYVGSI